MSTPDLSTVQEKELISRGLATGTAARALGLSFADRDVELIEYLKTLSDLPDVKKFPTVAACTVALGVDPKIFLNGDRTRWQIYLQAIDEGRLFDSNQKFQRDAGSVGPFAATEKTSPRRHRIHWRFGHGHAPLGGGRSVSILAGAHLQSLGIGSYVNKGIGGQKAYQGLARFDADVTPHHPVRVVFSFGGNDLNRDIPMEQICADLGTMIGKSRDIGADVVLPGLGRNVAERLWWLEKPPAPDAEQRRRQLTDMYIALCAKTGAKFVNFKILSDSDYCSDGIHPNQKGHDKLALELLKCWA